MKTITLLFFAILINACSGSKSLTGNNTNPEINTKTSKESIIKSGITKIEYVAVSRGIYHKIKILPETVTTQMSRNEKEVSNTLSNKDWTKLNDLTKEIDIPGIPKLKAPSVKHQYDGAAGAYLEIALGENVYRTVTFDSGNPPKEIAKVIGKLLSFSNPVKK